MAIGERESEKRKDDLCPAHHIFWKRVHFPTTARIRLFTFTCFFFFFFFGWHTERIAKNKKNVEQNKRAKRGKAAHIEGEDDGDEERMCDCDMCVSESINARPFSSSALHSIHIENGMAKVFFFLSFHFFFWFFVKCPKHPCKNTHTCSQKAM